VLSSVIPVSPVQFATGHLKLELLLFFAALNSFNRLWLALDSDDPWTMVKFGLRQGCYWGYVFIGLLVGERSDGAVKCQPCML